MIYAIKKNAKQLVLQDNLQKLGKTNNKPFSLADMYFLAHGKTWYESKFEGLQSDKSIENYRQKVLENTWSSIMKTIQTEYPEIYSLIKLHFDPIEEKVFPIREDSTKNGSAMVMFQYVKDNRFCEPFTLWLDYFIIGSKVPSLFASTWHLEF
jgi:hypothetical protein